jgi:hypothetical protein
MPAATVATIFVRSNNVIFSHTSCCTQTWKQSSPTILGLQDEHKAIKNGMQTVSIIIHLYCAVLNVNGG